MSIASDAYHFCSTFEAEILLELLLRFWDHPYAAEREYRNDLIEKATETLASAMRGDQFIAELPAEQMNFVAAAWYSEFVGLEADIDTPGLETNSLRQEWLDKVRSGLPSCFCEQDHLN